MAEQEAFSCYKGFWNIFMQEELVNNFKIASEELNSMSLQRV